MVTWLPARVRCCSVAYAGRLKLAASGPERCIWSTRGPGRSSPSRSPGLGRLVGSRDRLGRRAAGSRNHPGRGAGGAREARDHPAVVAECRAAGHGPAGLLREAGQCGGADCWKAQGAAGGRAGLAGRVAAEGAGGRAGAGRAAERQRCRTRSIIDNRRTVFRIDERPPADLRIVAASKEFSTMIAPDSLPLHVLADENLASSSPDLRPSSPPPSAGSSRRALTSCACCATSAW